MKSIGKKKMKTARMGSALRIAAVLIVCLGALNGVVRAKEVGLTAIEIYDGPSGAAYVQLTNVMISAKIEMRVTVTGDTPMDHGFYNKLNKVGLGSGGVLERGADGVLRYTGTDGQTVVVVPMNAKFDHGGSLSPAQLADQAVLRGTPVEAGGQLQQLGRRVKLVFVDAPDQELAEYLRAERAGDITGWRAYLAKYSAAKHTTDAKNRLATLFAQAGEADLDKYAKTAASATPAYDSLKSARAFTEQAMAQAPGLPEVKKLDSDVQAAVSAIADKSQSELELYLAALKDHTAGYGHLGTAKSLVETANGIESTKSGQITLDAVMHAFDAVDGAMRQAESSQTAKRYDLALSSIEPYRSFAPEEPRIASVIDGTYNYHMEAGKRAAALQKWDTAIAEFEKAEKAKGTPEERSQLATAREQWTITQDAKAAQTAKDQSTAYEQEKDVIKAYEVLDELPASQRKLVQDDMDRLQPAYIQRCSQVANEFRKAHSPLKGLSDEVGIETAFNYLQKAYKLSGDDSFKDRMDLDAKDLSEYLLVQAKLFLGKPNGSGTELAWTYLSQAFHYRADNLSQVRDAMTEANAKHGFRSKLSIRVQFRDQSSQGAGFATQLENAVIAELGSSKIQMKLIRQGEPTPKDIDPDYLIEGDVMRHHLDPQSKQQPVESVYVSGSHEVDTDEWKKADQTYQSALLQVQSANNALTFAQTKGKKHEIEAAESSFKDAQKADQEAQAARDAIPKTHTQTIPLAYTYIKKTVTLMGSIEMRFRINDALTPDPWVPIVKEESKTASVSLNRKPEDTTQVTDLGVDLSTESNQTEFMNGVENDALNDLKTAVRQKVEELPGRIYKRARQREDQTDIEGAGEAYMRYLELLPDENTPEAKHALQFLHDQFNMSPADIVGAP